MGEGMHPGDIIILAQREIIGTYIYEELISRKVPTKSYYQDAELDDVETQERFAFLKLAASKEDRVALRWLLGRHSTSWLSGGYARVRAYSAEKGLSPWDVLQALHQKTILIPHTAPLVARFAGISSRLEEIEVLVETEDLAALVDELFPDEDNRWRDLRDLALEILGDEPNEGIELQVFVSELSYAIAQPKIPSEIQDVRVMSLHNTNLQ
jgi:DNA helicase-2/ATP-dependent DNA helicase PcrA